MACASSATASVVERKTVGMKSPAHLLVSPKHVAAKAPAHLADQVASKGLAIPDRGKRPAETEEASRAPPPKRAKSSYHPSQATRVDAALVPPLPVIEFIQSRVRPKACGYCDLCKKAPCGTCKQCQLNCKNAGAEKRRCIMLKCRRFEDTSAEVAAPQIDPTIPESSEGISDEIATNCKELAAVSAQLSTMRSQALEHRYNKLLERKARLHTAQAELRNRKTHRKSPFPVGFAELWGIISKLEKARYKFATSIVKSSPIGRHDAIDRRRQKRDTLDRVIAEFCRLWGDELAPIDSHAASTFWKLVETPRASLPFDSEEDEDAFDTDWSSGSESEDDDDDA